MNIPYYQFDILNALQQQARRDIETYEDQKIFGYIKQATINSVFGHGGLCNCQMLGLKDWLEESAFITHTKRNWFSRFLFPAE